VSRFAFALVAFALLAAALAVAACGSTPNNGVNDVRKACDIRAAWKNPSAEKCGLCQGAAQRPPCGCASFAGFDGVCAEQGDARRAEPSCSDAIENCVAKCLTDCACVEACYANAPACKTVSAARDGCVADKCSAYCN
jgi:hypothetical protein